VEMGQEPLFRCLPLMAVRAMKRLMSLFSLFCQRGHGRKMLKDICIGREIRRRNISCFVAEENIDHFACID